MNFCRQMWALQYRLEHILHCRVLLSSYLLPALTANVHSDREASLLCIWISFFFVSYVYLHRHCYTIRNILAYLGLGLAQVGPTAEARVRSGESGMDGRFVLTVFFSAEISGKLLWLWQGTLGIVKRREMSWLAEGQLASQDGLCSMDLCILFCSGKSPFTLNRFADAAVCNRPDQPIRFYSFWIHLGLL
jgi:hypothetical protein